MLRVYPRACGGTQRLGVLVTAPARSIPARAGEPPFPTRPTSIRGVYPRACGGNLFVGYKAQLSRGSIPARAGEPSSRARA